MNRRKFLRRLGQFFGGVFALLFAAKANAEKEKLTYDAFVPAPRKPNKIQILKLPEKMVEYEKWDYGRKLAVCTNSYLFIFKANFKTNEWLTNG